MSVLSDLEIRRRVERGDMKIDPFNSDRLNAAGYDLCCDSAANFAPKEWKLVATMERVELPADVMGLLHIRSSFAREGLIGSLALVDPGFKGQLTISMFNAGRRRVRLAGGEPFLQISFVLLSRPAASPYRGVYQGSGGVVRSARSRRRRILVRVKKMGKYY